MRWRWQFGAMNHSVNPSRRIWSLLSLRIIVCTQVRQQQIFAVISCAHSILLLDVLFTHRFSFLYFRNAVYHVYLTGKIIYSVWSFLIVLKYKTSTPFHIQIISCSDSVLFWTLTPFARPCWHATAGMTTSCMTTSASPALVTMVTSIHVQVFKSTQYRN